MYMCPVIHVGIYTSNNVAMSAVVEVDSATGNVFMNGYCLMIDISLQINIVCSCVLHVYMSQNIVFHTLISPLIVVNG